MLDFSSVNEFKYTVSMRDTDMTGIVFHPRYLEILTSAREVYLESLGINYENLLEEYNGNFVVTTIEIRFLKPAFLRTRLVIKTFAEKIISTKAKIIQEVFSEIDDEKILTANIGLAFINRSTLQPQLIPLNLN